MSDLIKTGYLDYNHKEYLVNDIVYNPCFSDLWMVKQYTEQMKKDYDTDCDYYLALYGDPDLYMMDIDEPMGFVILSHKGDPDYDNYKSLLLQGRKNHIVNKEEESNEEIK